MQTRQQTPNNPTGQHRRWRPWVCGVLLSGSAALSTALGATETTGKPDVSRSSVPTVQASTAGMLLVGETLLRVWGFEIYTARLRAPAGFNPAQYEQQSFALELNYLRAFDGPDIARRSIEEMQEQMTIPAEIAQRWQTQLTTLFPNVKKGDRILGVHLPGKGAQFYLNDAPLGSIGDVDLARRFFGIWMSPATSQPAMRQALISGGRLDR